MARYKAVERTGAFGCQGPRNAIQVGPDLWSLFGYVGSARRRLDNVGWGDPPEVDSRKQAQRTCNLYYSFETKRSLTDAKPNAGGSLHHRFSNKLRSVGSQRRDARLHPSLFRCLYSSSIYAMCVYVAVMQHSRPSIWQSQHRSWHLDYTISLGQEERKQPDLPRAFLMSP